MATVNFKHSFTSPLRYPGGKGSLAGFISTVITENDLLDGQYVEAFAGGAGVAWSLLLGEYVQHVHINDIDPAIHAFWTAVLNNTDELCHMIRGTRVSMAQWHKQKAVQLDPGEYSAVELGFSTFFLNRTNRSGIISGGVIGGQGQTGRWKLNARYNKKDLIARIQRIARYRSRISVYALDGKRFVAEMLPKLPSKTLVYYDPPYYVKGKELYKNHFTHCDHGSLARAVQANGRQPWIVSYDDVPEISELYNSRRNLTYGLNYRAQNRYIGNEIMFFSDCLKVSSKPRLSTPPAIS